MPAVQRLITIMKTLRDPQRGCPWDREQTYASIAPYTLEETYEVLDAISREDFDDLRGELGDLLFQVVFYAQMADEEGRFNFDDVCHAISDKLERRHPHIFGDVKVSGSKEVLANWEQIKTSERAEKAQHSALDDIPRAMPALMRSHKIQKRCSSVGFDWHTLGPVLDPSNPSETYQTRLWPPHCIQDTLGSEFPFELDTNKFTKTILKGQNPDVEMYSAFYDPLKSPRCSDSGLATHLKDEGITHVYVVGLAADYCVKCTAEDSAEEGFNTFILEEGTRAVDPTSWETMKLGLKGVNVVSVTGEEVNQVRRLGH